MLVKLTKGGSKFSIWVRHGGGDDRGRRHQQLYRQVRGLPQARGRERPLANHHLLVYLDRRRPGLNLKN